MQRADVGLCRLRAFDLRTFQAYASPRFAAQPRLLLTPDSPRPPAARSSPLKRVDHIGIVSRYADRIRDLLDHLDCSLEAEGVVHELGVNCQYFDGGNVRLELVEPVREDSRVSRHRQQFPGCPLHHIAFEVADLSEALTFFKQRGYEPLDGQSHLGPSRGQRVMFLSPVQTGGLLVELVCNDAREYRAYGGLK